VCNQHVVAKYFLALPESNVNNTCCELVQVGKLVKVCESCLMMAPQNAGERPTELEGHTAAQRRVLAHCQGQWVFLPKLQPVPTRLNSPEKFHVSYLLPSEEKMLFVPGGLDGKARKMHCSGASL